MDPIHLMNITRKFESQLKKHNNTGLIDVFTERPLGEEQPTGQNMNLTGEKQPRGGQN